MSDFRNKYLKYGRPASQSEAGITAELDRIQRHYRLRQVRNICLLLLAAFVVGVLLALIDSARQHNSCDDVPLSEYAQCQSEQPM